LTRILVLDGLEPGKNKGGKVDSRARYIYVHGTNDEARIGMPASHGCVRLRNADVLEAFDLVQENALLLITERAVAEPAP
jgi:lipoprotein-anchoring transpeptidase ErfK/SrfK